MIKTPRYKHIKMIAGLLLAVCLAACVTFCIGCGGDDPQTIENPQTTASSAATLPAATSSPTAKTNYAGLKRGMSKWDVMPAIESAGYFGVPERFYPNVNGADISVYCHRSDKSRYIVMEWFGPPQNQTLGRFADIPGPAPKEDSDLKYLQQMLEYLKKADE